MYRLLFERVLARFDAERMHRLGFALLRMLLSVSLVRRLVRRWTSPPDPALALQVFGRELDGPLGLAAGFDKDAVGYEALYALGFGFIEIGTLTGEAQPGNPKPRLFRLVRARALVNRLGFNNGGSRAAAHRLARRAGGSASSPASAPARASASLRTRAPAHGSTVPLGINIGKTKAVAEADAVADYVASAERLGAFADYVVVNVSSPNTPGLRNLQATALLGPLLSAVRAALDRASPERRVPLLVKIAPDLPDEEVDEVAELALTLGLEGIIATNTTVARPSLSAEEVERVGAGGLSGAPLGPRALAVLRRLYARVGGRLVLIGVGGVTSAEDVLERVMAGATLVQTYTGFIYGGPAWPARVRRELSRLLRARGFASIRDAVGAEMRSSAAAREREALGSGLPKEAGALAFQGESKTELGGAVANSTSRTNATKNEATRLDVRASKT